MITLIRALSFASCSWLVAASAAYGQPLPDEAVGAAEPVETPGAETPSPTNWFETRLAIELLAEAGDFAAAIALEGRLLELAAEEFGPESSTVAEAYLLTAGTHGGNGDYTAAETNILRAIEIYSGEEGPLSPVLIDPFLDLGDNYDSAGDYASAISAYSEARTLGRRNFGLLNQDQIAIIDDMSAAAEQLGQMEEATALQLEALTLIQRNFENSSLEALEARYRFAAWLRDRRQFDEARRYYYEIQRVIDRDHENDPLLNVRMFRERAQSYREQDNSDSLGLSGLRDAIEMLESMPDPPALLMAEVYLDIGDWSAEFSRSGAIAEDYLEAWNWLERVENGQALRREWFEALTVVEIDPVSRRGLSADPDAPIGHVDIFFTVDTDGRARDLEITESDPPGFKDAAFMRQYQEARFRPRIENGELVEFRRARRNEFRYVPVAAEEVPN